MKTTCSSGFFGPEEMPLLETLYEKSVLDSAGSSPFILYKYMRAGKIVVLKAIKEEFRGNLLQEELLKKEFEIGKLLKHPNIREYYSLSTIPGIGSCIEMEWVEGDTLETLLPACREDNGLCDRIATQLIDAIKFIHLKQVVHRDLKPANILITKNGRNVKLIDFSLSDSDSWCILKGHAGTARYASPEQINCSGSDYRSDIFSLGVILSEMSDRRKYRKVAAKCMRQDMNKRYKDVAQLEKSLFRKSPYWVIPVAVAIVAASVAAIAVGTPENEATEEDYVDKETIEKIFQQATDLLEDPNTNKL